MSELSAIQDGLVQGEFFLEYLPICSLRSHRCLGAEALIRWRRGATVLLPGAFLPQVADTPLAGFLTYWVIETVGRELGGWLRAHPDGRLHLNVPPPSWGGGGARTPSPRRA
jgi:sensor c-di-GMP phosphodiesterase-like protein